MRSPKERIDKLLVDRNLVQSRERAKALIMAGKVFVDGKSVGDVEDVVLRDRKQLSEDGMVIPVMVINERTGEVVSGPDIISRGVFFEEKMGGILEQAKEVIKDVLEGFSIESKADDLAVENEVRRALKRFFRKEVNRRPVIIPVIIEM